MASIREIAKAAGVGVATVSRYMKGNGYVSRETGEKIDKVLQSLQTGDDKNTEKREQADQKRTRNTSAPRIGVSVPNIEHPFLPVCWERWMRSLRPEKWFVSLIMSIIS